MTSIVDQDQQWLLNCLAATLDPNDEVRSFAEASLNQASLQPGFAAALSKIAANAELPFGLRQLAAVLLKQFVKKHWQEDEASFEQPIVQSEEKAVIRKHLLLSLDDPHRKICTAISMAVASIAQYDWPEDWPELLPHLVKLISDQTNTNGVHGGLRCLALLSEDLDDTMVPKLVPLLFPCLHNIVSSPQLYDKTFRAKALSIVYSCTAILGAMSGVYKMETCGLMMPMLKPLMDQFAIILESPVQCTDPDDWGLRMEVLKCLNQIVQYFPSLAEVDVMIVIGPLWCTFVSSLNVYELSSIEGKGDPNDGRLDFEGAEQSLESFIIQLFEFLLTIVGNSKLIKVVASNVNELVYYTIAFMQMTEQQVCTWSLDANQYVADEDDNAYSCRVSGALLLEEVVSLCGIVGTDAVIDAAYKRLIESQRQKDDGSTMWWRIREAALFALASISEHFLGEEVPGTTKVKLQGLLEKFISQDMETGVHEYPFLHARVFSLVAKFFSLINHKFFEEFLFAAIRTAEMDVPPPVKVGACRALSQLLPEANKGVLHPHIVNLFSSLTSLLNQTSDETLHLVLETLHAAIRAGLDQSASIEPIISPMVLNMWASHVSDPFISIDTVELLETIKNAPGCIHPLVSRTLPYIGPILSSPHQQPDGLVARSLDLVTMLVKNAPIDIIRVVYEVCFDPVVRIILQSEDHSEMQNATECLATILCGGKQEMLSWSGDSGFTMRSLLDVASRLLDPDLESSGSLFVGSFILQLILHFRSHMVQHIQDLVVALVRRLRTCQIAGLRSSLLLIFARLVHMSAPNADQFIDLLISVPVTGYDHSFVYVMSEWTKQQGEIQGSYQIKVTTTALALLLSTRHPEMAKITVQGHLIKSTTGITTRSKAKLAPDQWTVMPLPAKILALIADVLMEIREQNLVGDNEESDWDEIETGDDETDHNLLYSVGSASFGRPTAENLDAMAEVFDKKSHDEGFEDDLLFAADPLNEINLAVFLVDFISTFCQSDQPLFNHFCQNLTQAQRSVIQLVLQQREVQ